MTNAFERPKWIAEASAKMRSLRRPVELGLFRESFEEYRGFWAVNASSLKKMQKSPLECLADFNRPPEEKKETPDMVIGTLAHCALFEPEKFERIVPEPYKRGTKKHEAWLAELPAGTVTERKQYLKTAREMVRVLWSKRSVRSALMPLGDMGVAEVSARFNFSNGLAGKCRFDYLVDGALWDYKTAADASEWKFSGAIANFGYHISAAIYLYAIEAITGERHWWGFIVQEKSWPYDGQLFRLDPEALECGRKMAAGYLGLLAEAIDSGKWPGYPEVPQRVTLPRWSFSDSLDYEGREI